MTITQTLGSCDMGGWVYPWEGGYTQKPKGGKSHLQTDENCIPKMLPEVLKKGGDFSEGHRLMGTTMSGQETHAES